MFKVRFHGRGGQGVVTAAELLAVAAFVDGREAQAVPSFGSERMGAPVVSYCRIDDRPIRRHDPVDEPDAVVVQDPTLLHHVDVFAGLAPDGFALVNTALPADRLGLPRLLPHLGDHPARLPERVRTVPATELAREHLHRPVPNTALLGALAALTGVVSAEAVATAISRRFAGPGAEGNLRVAEAAARWVRSGQGVASHA